MDCILPAIFATFSGLIAIFAVGFVGYMIGADIESRKS
jgi:hypothetical protein